MSRKIEDIDKKNIYSVPDGYFDKLPGIIQSRAVENAKASRPQWAFPTLKLAIPAIVLLVTAYFMFFSNATSDATPGELLAQVDTEDLVTYLASSDITTEEILENVDLAEIEFEFEIESSFLFKDSDMDALEEYAEDYFDTNEL